MIQANELRIGNKVMCKISNDAGVYEVIGIPAWGWDGCGDGQEPLVMIDRCLKELVPVSKLRPIGISAEILQACGFEKENNGWTIGKASMMDNDYFGLFDKNYCQGKLDLILNGDCLPMPKVKYLHQLQNLYWCLCGTELKISLPIDNNKKLTIK